MRFPGCIRTISRPIFAHLWEGAVVFGTTDLDRASALDKPKISDARSELSARCAASTVSASEPDAAGCAQHLCPASARSSTAARKILRRSRANPRCGRSPGLVNVTGGKLTTFRTTAREALSAAAKEVLALQPGPTLPCSASIPRYRRRSVWPAASSAGGPADSRRRERRRARSCRGHALQLG